MSEEHNPIPGPGTTYTLTDLFAYLWNRRTLLLVINAVGILIALVVTYATAPTYTATMIVASNGQSQFASGLTELATLTGHSGLLAGAAQADHFEDFIALYRSQLIAELADKKYGIREKIYSANWNATTKTWDMSPRGLVAQISAFVHTFMGTPSPKEPTYAAASDWLTRNIALTVDQDNGQWTAQIKSTDPLFAQWLLKVLYNTTESYLRATLKEQAQQQVDYLNKRLSQITVEDYRQSLLDILATQEKSLMMLESDAPVGARIVIPSTVTDQPTGPSTALNVAVGFIVSFILSVTFLVWLDWRRTFRRAVEESEPAEAELAARYWLKRYGGEAKALFRGKFGQRKQPF